MEPSYFPPTFEPSDPLPPTAGVTIFRLPVYSTSAATEHFRKSFATATFTFEAWLRPQGSGVLYSKHTASEDILTIRVNSALHIQFTVSVCNVHPLTDIDE